MRSHRTMLSCCFCASYMALCQAVAAEVPKGPAESPNDLPESIRYSYPPVPPAFWQAYVESLQADGAMEIARGLQKENVEPKAEGWSKELGQPLRTAYAPFMELVGSQRDLGSVQLERQRPGIPSPRAPGIPRVPPDEPVIVPEFWVFRTRQGNQSYFVAASEVEKLRFDVLRSMSFTHPLNARLDKYEADKASVLDIFLELLKKTGIDYDYAVNYTAASNTQVSLRLSGGTILDALRTTAEAANFELATRGFDNPATVSDPSVGFGDVFSVCRKSEATGGGLQDVKGEPPVSKLEKILRERAAEVRKGSDVRFRLRPRAPLTINEVKVATEQSGRRGRG